ncbi:MAG: hypothetical protein KGI88_07915 [Betaproteobacteria bacterium]|nr:hypothetical protein [Betaproteobacteria bacterium]
MHNCSYCGDDVSNARWELGYYYCLMCGEDVARTERASWCVAPLHKSNYMLVTNKLDLVGLNNKGGLVK